MGARASSGTSLRAVQAMTVNNSARQRPRDRKEQLAGVAAELFRTRGYHEVGISDIASVAGVTGPAIYRHFTDKQDILGHVVRSGLDELTHATRLALGEGDAPAPNRIETLLSTLAKLSVDRREVAALWRSQRRYMRSSDQEELRRRSTELLGMWTRALHATRPELSYPDAELLCLATLSVFGSVSVHSTRIAKRRFEALLTGCARAVLHCTLPDDPSGQAIDGNGAQPSAQRQARPQVVRTSRREQLIIEAGLLFRERGFHEVSMEDIGAAAGISGPSVYRHFASKASLFMAAAQRIADRLEGGRERVSRSATSEANALRDLAVSYVEIMLTDADLMAVGQQMSALSDTERAELRRIQRSYVGEWVRMLRALRPGTEASENRILVHVALTIANDLLRTRRARARRNIDTELVTLMSATLMLPDTQPSGHSPDAPTTSTGTT